MFYRRSLRTFRQSHPRIEITVHTGVSARILEMVRVGIADVGLVTAEVSDRQMVATPLVDHETVVVVPPLHPLAGAEAIRIESLAHYPLILMEVGTNLRTYVDRLFNASGVAQQVTMELDNVEAIKRMIEAELGISLLPRVSIRAEVETGRLAALKMEDAPRSQRRITLVHRRDKYLSVSLRAFLKLLKAEIGI